ncbi:CvfB family protein [Clostridium septicum]|uniref:DNA-binding protein n=1 Tax=Clostridium septicum TaxID=1504 RepID=A0A9N7JJC2_CLOSE|nr:S1-like domain-containing RNA-binding protein [Clostridium septicum]AYE33304.1 DNA-binding protein [Clostridium septicum]MDU1314460.1 S1-like domain-containing RNA-binding protein [Clostridium septicum]QAS61474.1 S1 RNA-binding domain-containing protein [Clostridium septicum]UEC22090.1 S1 RNA-binding domain-containing protein [Clostridium septicum]USR99878.1 S1-like domain-containing RNA-binding protein [Clostridium septicum]
MINIGDYNILKVKREKDFGFYLGNEGREEVLLPKAVLEDKSIKEGDEIEVFVYRDSKDRPVATFKKPLAKIGDVAYLKVVGQTKFGAFVDFGLDRDIFVPIKEQRFKLKVGNKYLFYLYLDKTGRLAATTEVENYLENAKEEEMEFKVGDEVIAQVYSRTPSGTLNVAIDSKYKGLVLPNEYYDEVFPGEELYLRIKRLYEDGVVGLTPRKTRLSEREKLQEDIIKYMEKNGGFMEFNDKSKPEDIKATFKTSKNYFKMALGGLMKNGKIVQEEEGTRLK